ncbi:MAG: 4a-hydroxytetrahydrobiopterin dehydratase [Calditrichaeota bacterium]|nr:MAG: 4a-hydroxytetrahydrobiopterin dehydratase [Calditrichota bacterium]
MKLSETQIATELANTPGWRLEAGQLTRQFAFADFKQAMEFVNRVADLAEAMDHHPDILVSYNRVRLSLITHSAGGLTGKDFELARKINRVMEQG